MKKKDPNLPPEAAQIRRRAEERLRQQLAEAGNARTDADTERLVHELQVHQIELEMQNEQLLKTREEVEAGLEKYSDHYDFAPVGYMTLDREGTIGEANFASASLLGIERSRLVRHRLGLHVSPSDRALFSAFLEQVFESRTKQFCEVTLIREGHTPIEVRIEAAVAASGQECRAVIEDITQIRRAEEDRIILSKLESTGILAGGIAHDFNNLLTVVCLELELASALTARGGKLAGHLEGAIKASLLARGLTQQLITFAKGGEPARKPTRLAGVTRESAQLALSGSRVRCECALADDLWPAEVDEGQIAQVFRNIVLNAKEAMPEGGVVVVRAENVVLKSHEVASLPQGEYVRVSISDRGTGIAREVLPRVFDPYYSTKQRGDQKGMGLGLTICHTVIRKHGGAIAVDSEVGVGTTFTIYLPACRNVSVADEDTVPKVHPRPARILVMDDEEGVRKVVGASLRQMGHEVELVEEGEKAVEVFGRAKHQGRPFDAVILDLTVRAGLGAVEAIPALLRIDPAVKAVVMSGYADAAVVLEPERHGFKGVLAKPFDRNTLLAILARVLGPGPT